MEFREAFTSRNLSKAPHSRQQFYDNILEKRYRDVASHFLVQKNVILQVSSAEERNKFAEMTFVCDLCVCVLISNYEALLKRLDEARRAQAI